MTIVRRSVLSSPENVDSGGTRPVTIFGVLLCVVGFRSSSKPSRAWVTLVRLARAVAALSRCEE
jgi:hypothetical protein